MTKLTSVTMKNHNRSTALEQSVCVNGVGGEGGGVTKVNGRQILSLSFYCGSDYKNPSWVFM